MDRFLDAEVDSRTINTRNEEENYRKMEEALRKDLCKKNIREEEKKKGSFVKPPKAKPIDKKNFMNNIQNEIEVSG